MKPKTIKIELTLDELLLIDHCIHQWISSNNKDYCPANSTFVSEKVPAAIKAIQNDPA